jgi:hypothetical protein
MSVSGEFQRARSGADSMLAPEVPVDGLGALADPWEGMDAGMDSGIDSGAEADFGQADAVGYLSVPPSWADSLAMAPPDPGDVMTWPSTRCGIKPAPGVSPSRRWGAWSAARSTVASSRLGTAAHRLSVHRWRGKTKNKRAAQKRADHTNRGAAHHFGVRPLYLLYAVRPSWSRRRCPCWPCCCQPIAPSTRARWPARRSPGSYDPTG